MRFPFLIKIHGDKLEQPEIFVRKHPLLLAGQLALYLLLALAPIAAYLVLEDVVLGWLAHPALGPTTILLLVLFELCVLLFAYNAFMDWYLDIWVVTDERIIDVNQAGVFGREIAELQLSRVQDVTVEQRGIFATVFGYGRIRVQSAAKEEEFEFSGLTRPNEVSKRIIELVQNDQQWHREALAEEIKTAE
jgi:uncharacterized membrane protein YdbT with pleckstrin-like domain